MPSGETYRAELDYLVRYTEMAPVYFTPVWDAAETVAGGTGPEARAVVLELVGDLLDRGVVVGDMSPRDGEGVIPWDLSRDQILGRIERGMRESEDPLDHVGICWFGQRAAQ
ncbi:hypothetical protein [Streptomyces sp. NPDC002176]|uniref:hypothetical protein n=1 Tax=Streptomyces sp. NPDC002176 TaxID=3364634 RepID=UPI00384DDFBD